VIERRVRHDATRRERRDDNGRHAEPEAAVVAAAADAGGIGAAGGATCSKNPPHSSKLKHEHGVLPLRARRHRGIDRVHEHFAVPDVPVRMIVVGCAGRLLEERGST